MAIALTPMQFENCPDSRNIEGGALKVGEVV